MKTHYTYYAIFNIDEDGKEYSHAWKVSTSNNLLHALEQFPEAKAIIAFKTLKEAKETARAWNETSLKNGRYMFDRLYGDYVHDN